MTTTTLPIKISENTPPIGSIEAYIHWAKRIPILTLEQEKELALRFHEQGDLDAARQLILTHLRVVIHIAKGYTGYGLAYGDLIQEGSVGLMKAVKHFNPNMGVRLVTFAIHWIKAEIHEFILKNFRIVKVATTKAQRKLFFNLRKMTRNLLNEQLSSMQKVERIASSLNVKTKDVTTMQLRMGGQDISLDPTIEAEEQGTAYQAPINLLAAPKNLEPHTLVENEDFSASNSELLKNALTTLDQRSREIVMARWLNGKKITLQELAKKYGVSLERIRQIEAAAFKKLRSAIA